MSRPGPFSAVLTTLAGVPSELDLLAASRLTDAGQRYTANRRRVVGVLATAGQPLTIPEILDRDTCLAQSSVYRNLAVLVQAEVVAKVVTNSEWARYELAEGLTNHHHHHLVCSTCGLVRDVELPTRLEAAIDALVASVAVETGFLVEEHRLDLVGRCAACR